MTQEKFPELQQLAPGPSVNRTQAHACLTPKTKPCTIILHCFLRTNPSQKGFPWVKPSFVVSLSFFFFCGLTLVKCSPVSTRMIQPPSGPHRRLIEGMSTVMVLGVEDGKLLEEVDS